MSSPQAVGSDSKDVVKDLFLEHIGNWTNPTGTEFVVADSTGSEDKRAMKAYLSSVATQTARSQIKVEEVKSDDVDWVPMADLPKTIKRLVGGNTDSPSFAAHWSIAFDHNRIRVLDMAQHIQLVKYGESSIKPSALFTVSCLSDCHDWKSDKGESVTAMAHAASLIAWLISGKPATGPLGGKWLLYFQDGKYKVGGVDPYRVDHGESYDAIVARIVESTRKDSNGMSIEYDSTAFSFTGGPPTDSVVEKTSSSGESKHADDVPKGMDTQLAPTKVGRKIVLAVLGAAGSGKKSFIAAWSARHLDQPIKTTLGTLDIVLDAADDHRYVNEDADGAIVMVDRRAPLRRTKARTARLIKDLRTEYRGEDFPAVVCGSWSDAVDTTFDDGCDVWVNAKTGDNIDDAVLSLLKKIFNLSVWLL